ncbi:MAG: hypothetical protein AUJ75_01645 [Candidatus Omnitrophica bacterium CG1_02_49_10]|nr:MAG: hypothetical protein AUJ75_01645 [Candidatus Omnitrophica bacterium CG1_02_49_10]
MFIKPIGWIYIALGTWRLIKPQGIKRWFGKKINKALRKVFLALTLIVSGIFINASFRIEGIWSKVLLILGILGIVKGLIFLKGKSFEKIMKWWSDRPLWIWRLWAAFAVAFGIMLLNVK